MTVTVTAIHHYDFHHGSRQVCALRSVFFSVCTYVDTYSVTVTPVYDHLGTRSRSRSRSRYIYFIHGRPTSACLNLHTNQLLEPMASRCSFFIPVTHVLLHAKQQSPTRQMHRSAEDDWVMFFTFLLVVKNKCFMTVTEAVTVTCVSTLRVHYTKSYFHGCRHGLIPLPSVCLSSRAISGV